MKKIIIALVAFVIAFGALMSCSDWAMLEEHPKQIASTTYLKNAEEVQSIINSVYYQLRRDAPGFGRYLVVLPEALSDYCWGRGNFASSLETGLTSGGQNFSKDSWAILFRGVRYMNEMLTNLDPSVLSDVEYSTLIGEARFLRAFNYSFLVKLFGGVALHTEQNWQELCKPRSSSEDIWNYVKQEAKWASENLPEKATQTGRPSKYSALLLYAEACLYLNEYSEAKLALKEIVESGKYSLVQITKVEDYDNIFGANVDGSSEEIFYIKYNRDVTNSVAWMYLSGGNKQNPTIAGATGIWTDIKKNIFIANWDTNDFRFDWNLEQNNSATMKGLTTAGDGYIPVKFRDHEATGSKWANDMPVYRYTDAMLYYAEAICQSNGAPDAIAMDMINQIHRRAYGYPTNAPSPVDYALADYNTKDKFMDLLLKERGYETMFEGKRYFDLKRLGLLAEYSVRAGKIDSVDKVGDAAYWWPIPADEFNYNPHSDPVKDQNPGY